MKNSKLNIDNIILTLIFGLVFLIRIVNLNYNSPFNDEAVYVVVGKMGLFWRDWESMNPFSWVGGHPYLYPSLSALSYHLGGITFVRLINVVFFLLSLYMFYRISYLINKTKKGEIDKFGLLLVVVLGFSSSGFYVSRLATYDMPSFYFFVVSLYCLLLANKKKRVPGKYYFLSSLFLTLSFYIKYTTGVFVPILIIYSYVYAKKRKIWFIYYLLPIVIGLGGLFVIKISDLSTFYQSQVGEIEKNSIKEIMSVFLQEINYNLVFLLIGCLILLIFGKIKELLMFLSAPVAIILVHLLTKRVPTFDKHLLYAVAGFSFLGVYGVKLLHDRFVDKNARSVVSNLTVILVSLYIGLSIGTYYKYKDLWQNIYKAWNNTEIIPKDSIVLTNLGSSMVLGLIDKTYPTSVFTSDWVEYEGKIGEEAVKKGVDEGFFNAIILGKKSDWLNEDDNKMYDIAISAMDNIYVLAWKDLDFNIYLKGY